MPHGELKMVFIASFPRLDLVLTASVKSELTIAESISGIVFGGKVLHKVLETRVPAIRGTVNGVG